MLHVQFRGRPELSTLSRTYTRVLILWPLPPYQNSTLKMLILRPPFKISMHYKRHLKKAWPPSQRTRCMLVNSGRPLIVYRFWFSKIKYAVHWLATSSETQFDDFPQKLWSLWQRRGWKRTTQQTGQHGGIRSSAIPATPDDGTSQGRRRT